MKTILIIEDDHYLTRTLSNILGFEGYNVHSEENIRDAMLFIKESKPDLILSDIALIEDNGYKLLRRLRKSAYCNIPFIFVSGKTKAKEIIHGLQSGADDYITKPFTYNLLIQKIKINLTTRVKSPDPGFNGGRVKMN